LAVHNLAGALVNSSDKAQTAEARELLKGLRERFLDYLFARTSLAQLAIIEGDLQTARELVARLRQREQMHRSEMMAVLGVNAALAIAEGKLGSAQRTVSLMEELDADHPSTIAFRQRLDHATSRTRLLSGPKGMGMMQNLASRLRHLTRFEFDCVEIRLCSTRQGVGCDGNSGSEPAPMMVLYG